MRTTIDGRVLRMYKLVLRVYSFTQLACPGNQLIGAIMFQSFEIGLHINNGIKITAISYVNGELTQVGRYYFQSFCCQVTRYIGELYAFYFPAFLFIADHYQPRRRFHTHGARYFRVYQSFLNSNGNSANGTVATHG